MSSVLTFLKQFGATGDMKASAIATAIQAFTGSAPKVEKKADASGTYIEITPNEKQNEILRMQLEAWLDKAPGDVRVNLSQIWWPILIKRNALYVAGIVGLSAWLGRKSV